MRTQAHEAPGAAPWEREFDRWLRPFGAALGDKRRQQWAPVHARGLLGPGERKSIEVLIVDDTALWTSDPSHPPRARRRQAPMSEMLRAAHLRAARMNLAR